MSKNDFDPTVARSGTLRMAPTRRSRQVAISALPHPWGVSRLLPRQLGCGMGRMSRMWISWQRARRHQALRRFGMV